MSLVEFIDDQKTVRWSAKYYPYGELYSEYISATNDLRFPGQWHDRESGLYYNWRRYYDPSTGRYLQPDPIGLAGGMNLYAYVGNNPISRTDRMGLDWYEMPNGDLMWSDPGSDFVGPMGRWYATSISYQFLRDDGSFMNQRVNPDLHPVIPNVTADFLRRMSVMKAYGWGQRALGLTLGEGARAFPMAVYSWYAPCDLENSASPYNSHAYVRLFNEVMAGDDPGNILYGYGATAAGYGPLTVIYAGGLIQVITDYGRAAWAVGREFGFGPSMNSWGPGVFASLTHSRADRHNTPTGDWLKDTYFILRGVALYNAGGAWK